MNRVQEIDIQIQFVKLCIKDKLQDGGEKQKAKLLCLRIDASSVGTVMDCQMSQKKETTWRNALVVAKDAYTLWGLGTDMSAGSMWYHAQNVKPRWRQRL